MNLRISFDGHLVDADLCPLGGARYHLLVEGRSIDLIADALPSRAAEVTRTSGDAPGPASITTPMAGRVVRILVAEGEEIARDAPVAVIEAMKMENELRAPRAGRISGLRVEAGAAVEKGAVIATIA